MNGVFYAPRTKANTFTDARLWACWLPIVPVQKLTHVDVEIGSVEEFSDLIVL